MEAGPESLEGEPMANSAAPSDGIAAVSIACFEELMGAKDEAAAAEPAAAVVEAAAAHMDDEPGSEFSGTEGSEGDAVPADAAVAVPAPPQPTAERAGAPILRDAQWRSYRRSVEWRCRWAELRMAELRERERRYAALEASLLAGQKRKGEEGAEGEAEAAAEAGDEARLPSRPWLSGLSPHRLLHCLRAVLLCVGGREPTGLTSRCVTPGGRISA